MTRNLDGDEKGLHNVVTHGGVQEMLIINESGLYSAALDTRNSGYLEPSLKPRSRAGLFVSAETLRPVWISSYEKAPVRSSVLTPLTKTMEVTMSNPYESKSSAHAAALELTLAVVEKCEIGSYSGNGSPEEKAARVASFINKIFNDVLANLEAKK